MSKRYQTELDKNGKITIPWEICNLEQLMLRPGIHLQQALEHDKLVLYRLFEGETTGLHCLDVDCAIPLRQDFIRRLGLSVGEALYLSVAGDIILAERASCERCGAPDRRQLVEYEPTCFMCLACVARIIYFEKERRR